MMKMEHKIYLLLESPRNPIRKFLRLFKIN